MAAAPSYQRRPLSVIPAKAGTHAFPLAADRVGYQPRDPQTREDRLNLVDNRPRLPYASKRIEL
jgi:hypothetical protein